VGEAHCFGHLPDLHKPFLQDLRKLKLNPAGSCNNRVDPSINTRGDLVVHAGKIPERG
jgi:hypothetical protein